MSYKTSKDIDRLKQLIEKEDFLFLWSEDNDGKVFRASRASYDVGYWIQDKDEDYFYKNIDDLVEKFIELGMGFIDPDL